MPKDPPFVVVALSGRALAQSARKAGYRTVVLDLFNDTDTRAHSCKSAKVRGSLRSGLDPAHAIDLARRLAPPQSGLVYGSGFESRPGDLALICDGRRLFGNSASTLSRVKDPAWFFPLLGKLGIPHPETRTDAPDQGRGWLVKATGAAGGAHIRPAGESPGGRPCYFQRRVAGRAVSALFLADGKAARVLGFSEQWPAALGDGAAFRFGGAALPARLAGAQEQRIAEAVDSLAGAAGLVGLNSADAMVRDGGFDMLEVNPRPSATLDIFDAALGLSLFHLHVRACMGELPGELPQVRAARASAIVYADGVLAVPPSFSWPDWAADLPEPGTRIDAGQPVCTVLAEGGDAATAKNAAMVRAGGILAALDGGGTNHLRAGGEA